MDTHVPRRSLESFGGLSNPPQMRPPPRPSFSSALPQTTNSTIPRSAFVSAGPGTISPIEALWRKRFQLDQQKMSQDIAMIKNLVGELASKSNSTPPNINNQKELVDLRRDINNLRAKQNGNALQTDVALLIDQIKKVGEAVSSISERAQATATRGDKANSDTQDQVTTLRKQVLDLQNVESSITTATHTEDCREGGISGSLLDKFLKLQNCERQIQREALERIDETSRLWRERIYAPDDVQRNISNREQNVNSLATHFASSISQQPTVHNEPNLVDYQNNHDSNQQNPNNQITNFQMAQSRAERSLSIGSSTTGTISEPECLKPLQSTQRRSPRVLIVPKKAVTTSSLIPIKPRLPIYQQQIEHEKSSPNFCEISRDKFQEIQNKNSETNTSMAPSLKRPSTVSQPSTKRPRPNPSQSKQSMDSGYDTPSQARRVADRSITASNNLSSVPPNSTIPCPQSSITENQNLSFQSSTDQTPSREVEKAVHKPRRSKRSFEVPAPYDPDRPRTRDQFRRRQEEYNKPPSPFTSLEVMQAKGEWAGRRLL